MSHQPFETWNLDRASLTPEQRKDLDRHVESCPLCAQMRRSWELVQHDILTAERLAAPVGFAARFQKSIEDRRIREHRRQVRKILIWLCASIALVLTILAGIFVITTPPANWIGSAIQAVAQVPFNLRELLYIVTFWVSRISIHPLVFLALGAVSIIWVMILIITGALTYSRLHREGEIMR